MDKTTAINLSRKYLIKVRENEIVFSEAWLFGSFAKGDNNENSDIDLAIVLPYNNKSFNLEVKLMTLRIGNETIIEPHAFNQNEFEINSPIVYQILQNGIKININTTKP